VDVVGRLIAQGEARGEALERFVQRIRQTIGVGTQDAGVHTTLTDFVRCVTAFGRGSPLVIDTPIHHAIDGLVDGLVVRISGEGHAAGKVTTPARLGRLAVVVQAEHTRYGQVLVGAQAQ